MIDFVQYRSEADVVASTSQGTFADISRTLGNFRNGPCASPACPGRDCPSKRGSAWSPVKLVPGGRRRLQDVALVTLAVFDLDHLSNADLAGVFQRVDAAGLAAIAHSTHSHRPEKDDCCVRLVLHPSRPMLPAEWTSVRASLEARLDLRSDQKAKDASRLFFLPSSPIGATTLYAPGDDGGQFSVERELAESPQPAPKIRKSAIPATPREGGEDLVAYREKLKGVTREGSKELIRRVLKGSPLAQEGERDDTLQRAAGVLAFELPEASTDALVEILRESVTRMPGPPPPGESSWLPMARSKVERAQQRKAEEDATRAADNGALLSGLRAQAAVRAAERAAAVEAGEEPTLSEYVNPLDAPPYSDEEIALFAEEQKCSIEQLKKRWIIQRDSMFYVLVNGVYRATGKEALYNSLLRDLARASRFVQLVYEGADGKPHQVKPSMIVAEHTTVARKTEASLILQRSYYDAETETFHEAVCPIRASVKPVEHPEIDGWLRLLGGDQAEKLLDWVATVPDLSRQSCALYIHAESGVGKTLFAHGLARIWTPGNPTTADDVFSGFNAALADCPLIFADEKLPSRVQGITSELRRLIGSTSRPLTRKFMATSNLEGAIRLIIAANNQRVFDRLAEDLDNADLDAVASRFLYVKPDPTTGDYIAKIGQAECDTWRSKNKIAEHALWLRDNRKVDTSQRFLVSGINSEFHNRLATQGLAGKIIEWTVRFILDPRNAGSAQVLVGEGEVWVSTSAVCEEHLWQRHMPSVREPPTMTAAGRALRGMCSQASIRVLVKGAQMVMHRLPVGRLIAWVADAGCEDPEVLRAKINQPNDILAAAKRRGT